MVKVFKILIQDWLLSQMKSKVSVQKMSPILERLNTHELQIEEKREPYGSSYRKSHALKPIVDSSSEEEIPSYGSDDTEAFGEYLTLLVKKFNRFKISGRFKKNLKDDSKKSSRSTPQMKL